MHDHRENIHLHDHMTSRSLDQTLTTKKKKITSMWIRKDNEPAFYETNKSQIGSTKSNGLSRSIGPHDLH